MDRQQDVHGSVSTVSAKPIALARNVALQTPLSRRGTGPGLLVFVPECEARSVGATSKTLDPRPLLKWAEEGFAVVEVKASSSEVGNNTLRVLDGCTQGFEALKELPECDPKDKFGIIVYDSESKSQSVEDVWQALRGRDEVAAIVSYVEPTSPTLSPPLMVHSAGKPASGPLNTIATYTYESAKSANFVLPHHEHYDASMAGVAHTRSLGFLRKHLGGPNFDLEAIWDEHCMYEFGERDVEKTMATMVEEPYVNHVPTMTGGVGRAALTAFYRDHFVFNNPEDTQLELISRTVGVDRVIDEFIFSFTHDRMIDWLIPGIPPTNLPVRIPFTSIVNIDRLYHEHIAWDQASILRQLGLLPEYLPFP